MTEYTIESAWQEDATDRNGYKLKRAIREATEGCPCEQCEWRKGCAVECRRFKNWVCTGQPQPMRK